MKIKAVTFATVLVALLAASIPLLAHHGGVAYEKGGTKVTLKGTISRI